MISYCFLLLLALISIAESQSVIESLPGFPGTLPFKLETGYVSVRETDDVQLFYYFIESENDPSNDPLLLWISGGPGCSAFSGLVYEIGPLSFDITAFNGSFPSFLLNPYSWTKIANIIFLDAPVGTGFSYSTNHEASQTSDTKTANDVYSFLNKWFMDHPNFIKNPFYLGGDSYTGKFVPIVALQISNDNDIVATPQISLRGYILGNGATDAINDENSVVPFAYNKGLISEEYYQSAKSSCGGQYAFPDPNNVQCVRDLQTIIKSLAGIHHANILFPECDDPQQPKPNKFLWGGFFGDTSVDLPLLLPSQRAEAKQQCPDQGHGISLVWANDPSVRKALHIRSGSIREWVRCNRSLGFFMDVPSVVDYHQALSNKGYKVMIYSGDHDMLITHISTTAWIRRLNLTMDEKWRPWLVDGQVAGFTEKYSNRGYHLTFATVKGGGHTAPEYKPRECFVMAQRWFAGRQL